MSGAEFHSHKFVEKETVTPELQSALWLKSTLSVLESDAFSPIDAVVGRQAAQSILTKNFPVHNEATYSLLRSSTATQRAEGYRVLAEKILTIGGRRTVPEKLVSTLASKLEAQMLSATTPFVETTSATEHTETPVESVVDTDETESAAVVPEVPTAPPEYPQAVEWLERESSLKYLQHIATKIDDEWLTPEDLQGIVVARLYLTAVKDNPAYSLPDKKSDRTLNSVVQKFAKLLGNLDRYRADEKKWQWRWSFAPKYDRETKPVPPEIITMRTQRFREVAERLIPGEITDEKWSSLKAEMLKDEYNFADQWSTAQANIRLVKLLEDHLHLTGENNTVFMVSYFDRKHAPKELRFPPKLPILRVPLTAADVDAADSKRNLNVLTAGAVLAAGERPPLSQPQPPLQKERGFLGWFSGLFRKKDAGAQPEDTALTAEQPNPDFELVEQSNLSAGKKEWLKLVGWGTVGAATSVALSIAGIDKQTQTLMGLAAGGAGYFPRLATAVWTGEFMRNGPDGVRKNIARKVFDFLGKTLGEERKWLTAFLVGYSVTNASPVGEVAAAQTHALGNSLGNMPEMAATVTTRGVGSVDVSNPLLGNRESSASQSAAVGSVDLSNPLLGGSPDTLGSSIDLSNPALGPKNISPGTDVGEVDVSNPLLGNRESSASQSAAVGSVDLSNPALGVQPDLVGSGGVGEVDLTNPLLGARPDTTSIPESPSISSNDSPRFDTELPTQPDKKEVVIGSAGPRIDAPPFGPQLTQPDEPEVASSRPVPPMESKISSPDAVEGELVSSRPTPPIRPELTPSNDDENAGTVSAPVVESALPQLEQTTLPDSNPWTHFRLTLEQHTTSESIGVDDRVDPIKDVFNALNTYAFDERGYAPDALKEDGLILMLSDGISMEEIHKIVQEKGLPVMFTQEQILRLDEYVTEALQTEESERTELQQFVVERLNAHTKFGAEANAIFANEFVTKNYDKLEQLVAIAVGEPEKSTPAILVEPESSQSVVEPIAEEPIVVTATTDTEKLAADLVADLMKDKAETEQPELKTESGKPAPQSSELTPNEDDASGPAPESAEEQQPEVPALETIITEEAYGENADDVALVLKKADWNSWDTDEERENLLWRANRIDALLDSNEGRLIDGDSTAEGFSPARRLLHEIAHGEVSPATNENAQDLLNLILSERGDFSDPDGIFGSLNRDLALESDEALLAYTTYILERTNFSLLENTLSYWLDDNNLPEGALSEVVERFGFVNQSGNAGTAEEIEDWFEDSFKPIAQEYRSSDEETKLAKLQELFAQFTAIKQPFSSTEQIDQLLQ